MAVSIRLIHSVPLIRTGMQLVYVFDFHLHARPTSSLHWHVGVLRAFIHTFSCTESWCNGHIHSIRFALATNAVCT